MSRLSWIPIVVLILVAALWIRLWASPLTVSASSTTLRIGETAQLMVARTTWFGTAPLSHPEQTAYMTTSESKAVVEPDGRVTAVGTWGEAEERARVAAFNGHLEGTVYFSLRSDGPGPTLDFDVEAPAAPPKRTAACCSAPVDVAGGQRIKFRLTRRNPSRTDLTRRSTGTRYTVFFGSGVPNDPNPANIVGYGEEINPATFRIDDEHGLIETPVSIGQLQHFTVLIFARNGADVGWKEIRLLHEPSDVAK
jgi:hypothetical protein